MARDTFVGRMQRVPISIFLLSGAIATYAASRTPKPAAPAEPERNFHEVVNGLSTNGLLQDLVAGTLTSTVLSANPQIVELAEVFPTFLKYLTECALREDQSVTVETSNGPITFQGAVGLAAEWGERACDVACQEWVSACLLARTNVYEIPVRIFLNGINPALNSTVAGADDGEFSIDEGAFYGNYFVDPPRTYTCRGGGDDPLYLTMRVCTLPGNICGYQSIGPCGAIDGNNGLPTIRHACEAYEDGIYRRCHNRLSVDGEEGFPEPNRVYDRVIAIRVRHSGFAPGLKADCVEPPPDGGISDPPDSGIPPNDGGIMVGLKCMTDEDCDSNRYVCDVRGPQPTCTASCTASINQMFEQGQCGGAFSTCLAIGPPGSPGTCTRICRAGRTPQTGGCPVGSICTGLWLQQSSVDNNDRVGCYAFCETDADCTGGLSCNPRYGACGAPVDESLLPDGEPCDPNEAGCRGLCLLTGSSTVGQCASVINLARTQSCPDNPQGIFAIFPNGDDLGICVFENCTSDMDCTPPTTCRRGPAGDDVCISP